MDLRSRLRIADEAVVQLQRERDEARANLNRAIVPAATNPMPLTAHAARDVVLASLQTRISFPDGITLRGRMVRGADGRWEHTLDVTGQSSAVGYNAMMRAARRIGAPGRTAIRDALLRVMNQQPPQEWSTAVNHLRLAVLAVPMDDNNADAGYQHILAAMIAVAEVAGIPVEVV
jgi:hypothetical protein